ncbi:MAG: phosphopantetheine-binding protein [Acidobacteriota bacterium]|nr:phosphopantetheine-binding protein [Acidobacteriota bacterium]
MNVAIDQLLAAVRSFVREDQGLSTEDLDAETQLFQEGYIDSFAVVRLIADLEQRLSLNLPSGALIPEDFATVSTLHGRLEEL